MRKLRDGSVVFFCGAVIYGAMELLWRGFTHWTMPILGGLCLLAIYAGDAALRGVKLVWRMAMAAVLITAAEFGTGCLVNLALKWNVWDYSARPGNILGQICPLFMFFWFLASYPAIRLCRRLRCLLSASGGRAAVGKTAG